MKLSMSRLPGRSLRATSHDTPIASGSEISSVAIVRVAVLMSDSAMPGWGDADACAPIPLVNHEAAIDQQRQRIEDEKAGNEQNEARAARPNPGPCPIK